LRILIELCSSSQSECSRGGGRDLDVGGTGRDLEDLSSSELESLTESFPVPVILVTSLGLIDSNVDGSVFVRVASSNLGGDVGDSGDSLGNVGEKSIGSDEVVHVVTGLELLHKVDVHELELLEEEG